MILCGDRREGVPRKPDPSALLLMTEDLGAEPSEIIYIGDSEVDIADRTGSGGKDGACILGIPAAGRTEKSRGGDYCRFHTGDP